MRRVLGSEKHVRNVFKFSYGEKLFLHICKLKWFKGKQISADGNVFICSQGPYRAVNSDRDLATLFRVQEKLNCMASREYIIFFWGGGGGLVSGFVTSLA